MTSRVKPFGRRLGIALMATVVTMVILSLIMSAIAWQILASGRLLQHREYQLQAELLARAGIEVAAARLLEQGGSYRGETLELAELSQVAIQVNGEPNQADVYRVSCEARYPTDVVAAVARSQTRWFKRVVDGEEVRLECILRGLEPDKRRE